ncbi:CE290 protein, partial [Polypterus senegalus]
MEGGGPLYPHPDELQVLPDTSPPTLPCVAEVPAVHPEALWVSPFLFPPALPVVAEVLRSRAPKAAGHPLAATTCPNRVELLSSLPVVPKATRAVAPPWSGEGESPPPESGKAYHELQRENLKLCSENVELHFKLEQAKRDLPRIKDQAESLKIMCVHLKKEKNNLQRKTGNVAKSGRYDKSVPELEKTIALMKKVVEKLQKENEELKETLSRRKLITLENENEKLKSDFENLKLHMEKQLNAKNEPITKEMHKIINENEELCEELKRIERLQHYHEEPRNKLDLADELQNVRLVNSCLEKEKAELLCQLENYRKLSGTTSEQLSEPGGICDIDISGSDELLQGVQGSQKREELMKVLSKLQSQLRTSELERSRLKDEVKKLKMELRNFDPSFFDEIEDLKYTYKKEVEKNIALEEKVKELSKQLGIPPNTFSRESMD